MALNGVEWKKIIGDDPKKLCKGFVVVDDDGLCAFLILFYEHEYIPISLVIQLVPKFSCEIRSNS